jgi:Leucine-rich repeat (LRR) protein
MRCRCQCQAFYPRCHCGWKIDRCLTGIHLRAGQEYPDGMANRKNPIPDSTTDKPPRSRRWIPVSVRLVLLLFPLLGFVGFTWIAVRSYGNAVAINAIEQLGGNVGMRPRTPQWLQHREYGDWTQLLDDVVSVQIAFAEITDDWLPHLEGLSSLEELELSRTPISDAGLVHLKGFKNLQVLKLDHTLVTDAGMAHLSGVTNLESLSLAGTQVGDAGLGYLSRLHNLRRLELDFTRVTDAGLMHLSGLHNLRELDIQSTEVTDAGLTHLNGLTNLRSLKLSGWPVTDGGKADLQRALPELTIRGGFYIVFSDCFYQDHSPFFFASGAFLMIGAVVVWLLVLTYLLPLAVVKQSTVFARRHAHGMSLAGSEVRLSRRLWFSRTTIALLVLTAAFFVTMPIVRQQVAVHALEQLGGRFENEVRYPDGRADPAVSGLGELKRSTSLQELQLGDSRIVDRDLTHLERLTTLQVLWLNDTPITDAALPHLRNLVELRELHLDHTRVTDAGLAALKSFRRLNELDLSNTPITDAGMVHVADLVSLKHLCLSNTAITAAGASRLSGLTELQWLDLEGTGVSDAGLAHLAKLGQLQHLELADMPQLTGTGLIHLGALQNLESLSLGATRFTPPGVAALQKLKNLKTLSLKNARMSDTEIADLKRALPEVYVRSKN